MTFPNYLYNWTPHVHDAYGVFLFIKKRLMKEEIINIMNYVIKKKA